MTREQALGVWARAPRALIASPRRRRLVLVGAAAPGALAAVLGTHLAQDPRLLVSGAVLVVAALIARRLSEPRFVAWEAAQAPSPSTARDPAHAS